MVYGQKWWFLEITKKSSFLTIFARKTYGFWSKTNAHRETPYVGMGSTFFSILFWILFGFFLAQNWFFLDQFCAQPGFQQVQKELQKELQKWSIFGSEIGSFLSQKVRSVFWLLVLSFQNFFTHLFTVFAKKDVNFFCTKLLIYFLEVACFVSNFFWFLNKI